MEAPDRLIAVNIDVAKIDKTKLHRGAKGTYLDLILMPRDDQFGNHYMVVQGIPKEDRDAGQRGEILGNGKFIGQARAPQQSEPAPITIDHSEDDTNLPF